MDDNKAIIVGLTILALAVILLAGGGYVVGVLSSNNDHDFDRVCIASGKSVEYIAIPGSDNIRKVCQK